ncbi:hypothetical protein IGS59_25480 [Janthinobacterium sp. GW460P]|uniref:hypothetical protein n=1 Tax=unclassified Janthinobacterium TaxID=2610881 RepID=UPI00111C5E33|nr:MULTISPECIES: hypothetical protein [unclassified Janthinobacterium]MCC7705598.1 hypothetical protein [Janthinobacterium sp. GW460P]MCC7711100.1 hypothetical protein [Janthinobacterium sp. GW460W]
MTVNLEPVDGHLPSFRNPSAPRQGQQERWLFELETALLEQGVKKNAQRPAADTGEGARPPQPAANQTAAQRPLRADAGELKGNTLTAPALPGALPNGYTVYGVAVAAEAGALPRVAIHGTVASDTPDRTVAVMRPSDGDGGGVVRTQPLALLAGLSAGSAANSGTERMLEAEPANMPLTQLTQDDTPDYALRQMHLYRESGGVRAWIRDASLNAVQERLVAQAMLLELHGAGTRMTALTVNGKEILIKQKAYASADCFVAEPMPTGSAGIPLINKDAL